MFIHFVFFSLITFSGEHTRSCWTLWFLPIQTDAEHWKSGFWLGILFMGILWNSIYVLYGSPHDCCVQERHWTVWIHPTLNTNHTNMRVPVIMQISRILVFMTGILRKNGLEIKMDINKVIFKYIFIPHALLYKT